jgi:hypothetical protein
MAKQVPSLSQDTKNRIVEALTSVGNGNQLIGSLGLYGGFVLNSNASVKQNAGDIQAAPDSGGAPGTYRVFFPQVNAEIQSIDWLEVAGFTPRNPTGVETCAALVCGYNFDTTKSQWYITVQIVNLSDYSVNATPPQNFVVGVRASVTLKPTANRL